MLAKLRDISPDILSVLGNACLYLHDFKRAAAFYEQCLEQIPANPRWLNNLASCYAKIGQKEAARLGYMAALQVNPNYQDAKRNLLTLSHI